MSDWKKRSVAATPEEVAGWKGRSESANQDTPVQGDVGPLPGGYVKSVDPASEEAQLADLNTKRTGEENASNLKTKTLEGLAAAAQTGSLNTSDQLAGVISYLKGKGYRTGQQDAEGVLTDAQQKHPLASLAGVLPSLLVPGGQTIPARMVIAGLTGAASSAGATPGNASALDTGKNALEGMGTGLAIQGGSELASKGLGALAQYLQNKKAPELAVRAAAGGGSIENKLESIGMESTDEARQLGRDMLDNGMIPAGGKREAIDAASKRVMAQGGNAIGQAVDLGEMSGVPPDYDSAMWAVAKPAMMDTQFARENATAPIQALVGGMSREPNPSWAMLQRTKSQAGKGINWGGEPPLSTELARKSYGELAGNFADQLENAAGPQAADLLGKGNKLYSLGIKGHTLSNDAALRAMVNQGITLRDIAMGMGGAGLTGAEQGTAKGGVSAIAIAALAKLLRERGPSMGARVADDVAAPSAQALSAINQAPAAVGSLSSDEEKRRALVEKLQSLMGN